MEHQLTLATSVLLWVPMLLLIVFSLVSLIKERRE